MSVGPMASASPPSARTHATSNDGQTRWPRFTPRIYHRYARRCTLGRVPPATPLREVMALFFKLGVIGFGGPAAHIALMREEVVKRRKWVSDERFLDLLGMTNLIPGPNSTEMAIHLGYTRAGGPGLVAGGACFVVPAMVIVWALAWAYVRYGAQPQVGWLLYGVKPVIIAVVVQAIWALLRTALKGTLLAAVALAVLALSLIGVNEIALLAPVLPPATFVGSRVGGGAGAVLATVGIFLPSFVFVAASRPLLPKIRASRWTAAFLDGVNVAALGLMAAVTWELARAAVIDWLTALLALVAAAVLIRFEVNSVWLILGGGVVGLLYRLIAG